MEKMFDSELKIMDLLWKMGAMDAKTIAKALKDEIGWNKNTTYTVLKKCVAKQFVQRSEPNFLCTPLVTQKEVQEYETADLIKRQFHGDAQLFFSHFCSSHTLGEEEIKRLRKLLSGNEYE